MHAPPGDENADRQPCRRVQAGGDAGRGQPDQIRRQDRADHRRRRRNVFFRCGVKPFFKRQLSPCRRQDEPVAGHELGPGARYAVPGKEQAREACRIETRHGRPGCLKEEHAILAHDRQQLIGHRAEVRDDKSGPGRDGVFVARRHDLFDDISGLSQRQARLPDGLRHKRVRGPAWRFGDHRDPARGRVARPFRGRIERPGIARVRARDHLEREPHVGDGPRHRPVHLHHLHGQRAICSRNDARVGHAALGRPDRCDAAGVGGIAQRAADVVAKAEGRHTRGQSRRLLRRSNRLRSAPHSRDCA